MIKKTIALLLALSVVFSNIVFADTPKNIALVAKKQVKITTDPERIIIPRDYGLVKSRYTAKDSKKLVIHIQDAHCNYEAQSNIIKILECLIENDGLGLISVEGADGFIDTSWFKAFPDADIRKEVAGYFMKKGEITGPEFLSITSDYSIKLFGAETRSYYVENLNAFTSSYPLKEDIEKYFNQIKTVLNKLKNHIYSDELEELDTKSQDYESKKLSFTDYVKYLESLGQKHKVNLRQYGNLFKLVSVLIYEKKINFNVVDKERATLIDVITKKLEKEALTELVSKSLEFKVGKISSSEYYAYLKDLASKYGISLVEEYPNLFNYVVYNSVYSRIENEKLFSDIKKFEEAVKDKLFVNDDQRTLDKLSRHINILLGLVNVRLLNGDFDYYKSRRDEFTYEIFAGFIKKMTERYGFAYEVEAPSPAVTESMSKLEDFYSIAIKRDKALVDNTIRAMKEEAAQVSALVTGGFHSEGITKLLEKQGISYIVVCPNITKDVETPYIKILTNQRTPLEEILSDTTSPTADAKNVKSGMLAPYLITAARTDMDSLAEIREIGPRAQRVLYEWTRLSIEPWVPVARVDLVKMGVEPNAAIFTVRFNSDVDKAVDEYIASHKLKGNAAKTVRANTASIKKLAAEIIDRILAGKPESPDMAKKKKDAAIREKTVGAALTDDVIDASIADPKTRKLVIFQDGSMPGTTQQRLPEYSNLIDALISAINDLDKKTIEEILRSPHVGVSPNDPIAKIFTKENLLEALEEGQGLKIVLVQPVGDIPRLRIPGIVMTKTGSTFGHYSTKNNVLYLGWGMVETLMEDGSVHAIDKIVASIIHELTEYVIMKKAFPGKVVREDVPGAEWKAHFIAQLFEVKVAGPTTRNREGILGPHSALDDTLEDFVDYYFRLKANPQARANAFRSKGELDSSIRKMLLDLGSDGIRRLESLLRGERTNTDSDTRSSYRAKIDQVIIGRFNKLPIPAGNLAKETPIEIQRNINLDPAIDVILRGEYVPEFTFAGAATRWRDTTRLDQGSFYSVDLWSVASILKKRAIESPDSFRPEDFGLKQNDKNGLTRYVGRLKGLDIPNDAITGIGMGPRQLIEYRVLIQQLSARRGISPDEALAKQKTIIHINEADEDAVKNDLLINDFYGFQPQNVLLAIQPVHKGYILDSSHIITALESEELPYGHGNLTMQLCYPDHGFTLDKDGRMSIIEDSIKNYLKKSGVKVVVVHRVNDLTKFTPDVVNMQALAKALELGIDKEKGVDVVIELVDNPENQKGGNWVRDTKTGRKFLLEKSNATTPELLDLLSGAYNAFRNIYSLRALDILADEGLPLNMRDRAGYLYFEAISGDLTQSDRISAEGVIRAGELIHDIKELKNLFAGIEYLERQDNNPDFAAIARRVRPTLRASETGAIRVKGGAATDHGTRLKGRSIYARQRLELARREKSLNGALARPLSEGNMFAAVKNDVKLPLTDKPIALTTDKSKMMQELQKRLAAEAPGKSFIVVKGFKYELRKAGLEHLTDVVFHYGVTRQAVYIDEEDLNYLFSLPNGVDIIVEGALHEKAHIDNETANLENPEVKLLSEEEIDRIAPSYNIRIAIRLKGVNVQELLKISETKISEYLTTQFDKKNISKELYNEAMKDTYKNLETWVTDPDIQRVSPNTKLAILDAIKDAVDTNNWADIVDVFRKDVSFGTAGIREKAALTEEALKKLAQYGPGAAVLKGPNTINDIVLLIKTAGVIQYAKKNGLHKVAIGYDSRIAGKQFAELIAQSFLAHSTSEHKFTVYLFDEASPFPELSFAVTTKAVRADLGILISASHNPSNYNGYKITDYTGAQLTGKMRDAIVETIKGVGPKDIQLKPLEKAEDGQLIWLGGKERLYGKDYKDGKYHRQLIDMHTLHAEQVKKFIIDKEVVRQNASKVKIGYSAFNGAGNRAVPRLLSELGFTDTKVITSLQEMNGMFPAFGWGEQPDPGDPISADIAVREFIKEHGREAFDALDILIGTDPDADRAGIIVKVPEAQQKYFGKYKLLSANDAWTLLLWYRIQRLAELSGGKLPDADKKYITFSHVTTDALEKVGELFGVRSLGEMRNKKGEEAGGYLNGRRSWVGFSLIAEFCQKAREKGLTNLGGAEESNGFSILGGPAKKNEVLADDGHVNDKDGAFAALLLAEVAAYAKSMNTTLFELLDNIYLNPKVGYFATANKPMPRVGAFKGAEGVTKKINLLKKAQEWAADANKRSGTKDPFTMAGLSVIGAMEFKTTKYDKDHYEGFPDEGIRFFFADSGLNPGDSFTMSRNYITIRPSGTSQTIRFYTQLFGTGINGQNLGAVKYQTARRAEAISLQAQVELLAAANYMEDIANIETQLKSLGFIPKNVVQFTQGKASIDLPVINSAPTSEQAAQIISQKLHMPLVAATAEMAARFMQGGYNQPGYGVPAGASIDGSFAIGNEGNQGYYVNGGKEIFLSTTASMRDFFERRARILGTPIKYVIKPGIGGQHTPFQSIASTFQVIDVKAGTVIGEYEIGKDYEASLLAAINKLGIKWEEIAVIPSSKSGSTDETMMIFNEIFYVLLKHISNLSYQSVNGEEFAQLVFDTLHEVNFINGKERSAKDLFKIDRERFNTGSLIDLIVMRAADKKISLTRDMVKNIFGKVLGNMFFETTDRPESSRLSAFIRNSDLDKELGENAPGFGGMFDNVGGRWTADLHMMTFLAYHKLDAEAYWNVRYEGIKQVREGTHQANALAEKILKEGITDIALVVPNELFWFGKAMEQNFNESIWQKGFANLVAIKESAWEAQKSHYAGKSSRLVINISSLDIPEPSFKVANLGEFKLDGVEKQELANSLGELFTTFYGMTHTYGNTLIVRALAKKGFTVADVDLNNLDNPATKIVQRNLYVRQPYVELGKGLLENKLKALQERGPQAIEEELGRIKEAARNGRLEMTSSEINFHDEMKNVEQLAGVIKQAVKFAEKTNRKFVPFIYLEGEKFLELRELLVGLGIEWVMQGTGDQHISYQQVLAQPQKYLPFIISFVPEQTLSGRPAIGFAKGYLHNVSSNMVRDLFAEASYRALTAPRNNEAGEKVTGAAGIFMRIIDTDNNRDMLAQSFEKVMKPETKEATFEYSIESIMQSSATGERARQVAENLLRVKATPVAKRHLIFVKSAIPAQQLATTTAINYANYCADYYNEMEGYTADIVDTYEEAIKLLAKNSDWDKTNTIVGLIDKWALDKITAELEKNGMQDKTKLLPMEAFDKDQFVPLKGFFDLMSVLVHVNRPLNRPEDQELRDTIKDLLNEIGVRDVNSLINALSVAAYFEDPIKFARNFIIRLLPPTKAASPAELRDRYNAAKKVVESL